MHCGAAIPAGAKFCIRCGSTAGTTGVAAPPIAAPAGGNPQAAPPAAAAPVEIPQESRTADRIQSSYRRSKIIRNVILAIPIIIYIVLFFTKIESSYVYQDVAESLAGGGIHPGFVITLFAIGLTIPHWAISEIVIRGRRRRAIRGVGMDRPGFETALREYENLKREGKLLPVADPGPIPEEVTTAVTIQARYRRRAAVLRVILLAVWLFLFFLPIFLLLSGFFRNNAGNIFYFLGFVVAYTIFHLAGLMPMLRRKKKKEHQKAGFDENRFQELLYLRKTLKREKRQWAAQEAARRQREAERQAAERLAAAKPAQGGLKSWRWIIAVVLSVALMCGLFWGGVFNKETSVTTGSAKTLDGLYIDAEGMRKLTFGVNLVSPPEIILFKSSGDVYFSQLDVVNNDAEMMQYGNHFKYTISGNTITIDGNTEYTGTIDGDTINLTGIKFVPGTY